MAYKAVPGVRPEYPAATPSGRAGYPPALTPKGLRVQRPKGLADVVDADDEPKAKKGK